MVAHWLKRAAVAALLVLPAAGAQALTLNVVGGGIEGGTASYGCPTATGTCSIAERDYALVSGGAATGTVSINPAGTLLSIELVVGAALFDDANVLTPSSSFSSVTYSATLTSFGYAGDEISFGLGTGSVSGFVNGNPLLVSPSVSISCNFPGGTGQCGIAFGEPGFTNVDGRDWRHTFDVTVALPEPASAWLVALGLAGLALRVRAR